MSGMLRIGVAGAGLIGRKHIELIAASPDCVLAGIADPSPEAKELAESHGIPWYGDHRALLERETPDGMIVASPNALHLPMALDCVARGVPVLIEKPVTDTVASAQRYPLVVVKFPPAATGGLSSRWDRSVELT